MTVILKTPGSYVAPESHSAHEWSMRTMDTGEWADGFGVSDGDCALSPEHRLLRAILICAYHDMVWANLANGSKTRETFELCKHNLRKKTIAWVSSNKAHEWSFRWICEHLFPGDDAYLYVRARMLSRAQSELKQLQKKL